MCTVFRAATFGIILVAMSSAAMGAALTSPTDVSFTADCDGTTQYYSQLLPTDFDASQQHDLLIALHGSADAALRLYTRARDGCIGTHPRIQYRLFRRSAERRSPGVDGQLVTICLGFAASAHPNSRHIRR